MLDNSLPAHASLLSHDPAPQPSQTSPNTETESRFAPVASWWHTVAIIAVTVGWALLSRQRLAGVGHVARPASYLSQVIMIWLLLGSVVGGIYARGDFFFRTLVRNRQPWMVEWTRGFATYITFAIAAALTAALLLAVVKHTPPHAAPAQKSAQPDGASGSPAADSAEPAVQRLHFKRQIVETLAPHNALEMMLWLGVSFSAGFCEEHIFRGYLLQQCLALCGRLRLRSAAGVVVSIALTSVLFGSLHMYEGLGGAVLITLLGATYAVVALKLGNLRTVIAAHTLQDALAGLFLFLRHVHAGPH